MGWFGLGIGKGNHQYFGPDDVVGIPRAGGEHRDPIVEACLAEFHALREEMRWLREEAAQYQGFALAITAALGPLLGYELAQQRTWVIPTLVVIPLPFAVLGFLFFRQTLEVYVEAAYIRDRIRPLLLQRCPAAVPDLWSWEEYKLGKFRELAAVPLLGRVVGHRLALFMRVCLFLGPAGAALLVETILAAHRGNRGLLADYHTTGCVLMFGAFMADGVLVLLLVLLLRLRGDVAHFVLGSAPNTRRWIRQHPE